MDENITNITTAEAPETTAAANGYTVSDTVTDSAVSNANDNVVLKPIPGTKYAASPDEDFGVIPSSPAAPYTVSDNTVDNAVNGDMVLTPLPNSKFASPDDAYGAGPAVPSFVMDQHGRLISENADTTVSNAVQPNCVIAPKPGSKFAS